MGFRNIRAAGEVYMQAGTQENADLCLKIIDLLEQDSIELSRSLEGEILDAYRGVVQAELKRVQKVRMQLQQAVKSI